MPGYSALFGHPRPPRASRSRSQNLATRIGHFMEYANPAGHIDSGQQGEAGRDGLVCVETSNMPSLQHLPTPFHQHPPTLRHASHYGFHWAL
ncbi:hypothetical protein E2C01_014220 [Portunus trituberculatus]|uniref:Uncharacterized protein n=1 Tax=Portunus trituberculatus TaxID=210409 RepID=A0A5B7DI79_PORTR|nr:hypothetical protein [Portunus trituberculatus]